jgi:hypothetical protein
MSTAPTHLSFNNSEMASQFDVRPFQIAHTLTNHPLLELPRLIELSAALPSDSVEYNAGDLPVGQDPTSTPRTGLSIEETLRRIEECKSWMVLKDVEQDASYRRLLDECLDQVQPAIEAVCPGMAGRRAFIFVSSPGAVTPYHVDFEYNFLLQIRGGKYMTVFDGHDRAVLSELERERAVSGAPRNLKYRDELDSKGKTFHLKPGVGVHVPLSSPHWVKVADEVSISFSITFHSQVSDRRIGAHKTNALLRRFGMSPAQVGRSEAMDSLKYNAHRVIRRLETVKGRLVRR